MKISPLIVILMLWFLIFTWAEAEILSLTLNAGDYEIVDIEDGQQVVRMVDFGNLLVPGKPMLPAKVFMIALPPGAEVLSVVITGKGGIELPGTYNIRPAPPPMPADNYHRLIEESIQEWQENYKSIYSSDAAYPEQVGQYVGTGQLRKYTFARVAFFPFVYHPKSGRLLFYPRCNVVINYSIAPRGSVEAEKMQQLLLDTVADDRASRLFVNYTEAKYWYTSYRKKLERQTYDYVIITSEDLQASVFYLVSWKQYLGHSVNVVTTTWISNNYSGADLQEKIRNFLIDKYAEWGVEYVLLVGNIDLIPMRYCFPNPSNHDPNSDFCTPTDYYYADLTGNWDSDGDGYYGECGQDSVDFFPEVIIGRIPWNSEVTGICQKLVRFEQDVGTWKNNALLLGALFNYENEHGYPRTDNAELMEEIISDVLSGWSYTTMYEMEGLRPCTYSCDLPLTLSNVVSDWSTNNYGIVNWGGHGSTTGVWRHIWQWDDGDSIPEDPEINSIQFFHNGTVPYLDDGCPSINFCASCNNAWPEVNNLARELIKHGSAGVVAATRPSYYAAGWQDEDDGGLASTDYYFFYYLINENEKVGDALFDADIYYFNYFFWWGWKSQHNMFTFCLYGDPALVREGFEVPLVSVYDYEWTDSGEDGHADPGDTLNLTVELLNSGIDASTVVANLSSNDPFITLIDSTSNYGQILNDSVKENSDDPFILRVNEDAPLHICTLSIDIVADGLSSYDTIFIMIGMPPVLVIDDDGGDSYETYFTQSLQRLGVLFDVLKSEDVIIETVMSDYEAVIWFTGDNHAPIDSASVLVLSNYLDLGGNLFVTGQDVEGCADTSFYHNYLHAALIENSAYRIRVDGVEGDTIGDGLSFLITGLPGANNQDSPSIISPIGGADSIFSYRLGGCSGVKYENDYRTVYLSYGFEAIVPFSTADTVMMRILHWFGIPVGIEEKTAWHDSQIVTQFLQICPNPFSKEMDIRYQIQGGVDSRQKTVVSMKIYDAAGRLVKSLCHTPDALRNTLSWDGCDDSHKKLPSGVYFLKFEAGDYRETRKLLLIR